MTFIPTPWSLQIVGDHIDITAPTSMTKSYAGHYIARIPYRLVVAGYERLEPAQVEYAANLIAAAPDMLAALQKIARDKPILDEDAITARAAIARAHGLKS